MKPIVSNVSVHNGITTYCHLNTPRDILLQFVAIFNFPNGLHSRFQQVISQKPWATIHIARNLTSFHGYIEDKNGIDEIPLGPMPELPAWLNCLRIFIDGMIECRAIVECTDRSAYETHLSDAGLSELWTRPALPVFNSPDDHFTETQLSKMMPDLAGRLPKIIETLRRGGFVSLELPSGSMAMHVVQNFDEASSFYATPTSVPPIAKLMRHYGIRFVFVSMFDDEYFRIEGLPLALCCHLKLIGVST